jgi:hypothetical protein
MAALFWDYKIQLLKYAVAAKKQAIVLCHCQES